MAMEHFNYEDDAKLTDGAQIEQNTEQTQDNCRNTRSLYTEEKYPMAWETGESSKKNIKQTEQRNGRWLINTDNRQWAEDTK